MQHNLSARRAAFAAAIVAAGIDLNTDFYALPLSSLSILADLARAFNYRRPAGYPGCLARAFYYSAQRAK